LHLVLLLVAQLLQIASYVQIHKSAYLYLLYLYRLSALLSRKYTCMFFYLYIILDAVQSKTV